MKEPKNIAVVTFPYSLMLAMPLTDAVKLIEILGDATRVEKTYDNAVSLKLTKQTELAAFEIMPVAHLVAAKLME